MNEEKKCAQNCASRREILIPGCGETAKPESCDCDGYHTFTELYEHRIHLFIALCCSINSGYDAWKSKLHSDGSSFEGWFILGLREEPGSQITYHLPMKKWKDCSFAKTLDRAPEWDGHTSADVLERVKNLFYT